MLGVPLLAENTPFEPEPVYTGVGKHIPAILRWILFLFPSRQKR